jgi:hypothetical protein
MSSILYNLSNNEYLVCLILDLTLKLDLGYNKNNVKTYFWQNGSNVTKMEEDTERKK